MTVENGIVEQQLHSPSDKKNDHLAVGEGREDAVVLEQKFGSVWVFLRVKTQSCDCFPLSFQKTFRADDQLCPRAPKGMSWRIPCMRPMHRADQPRQSPSSTCG